MGKPYPSANPLRSYLSGERVFVSLKLYNLERDVFGQTRFEIAYGMERPAEDELGAALFEGLDRAATKIYQMAGHPIWLLPDTGATFKSRKQGRQGEKRPRS